MKSKIVFATNNLNKLKEVQELLPNFDVLSLKDIGCTEDIAETGSTFHENALIKAKYVSTKYKISCFADDSGLTVEALNGVPGIFSARFAGEQKSDEANNIKLLKQLEGIENRAAAFVCSICYCDYQNEDKLNVHYFEGKIKGDISIGLNGRKGFGYDPLFVPVFHQTTFAEMTLEQKNKISHRARAVTDFVSYITAKI